MIKKMQKKLYKIQKKKVKIKLEKKWKFWREFKQTFISSKKITFFTKLQAFFNNIRIVKHQLVKSYLPQKRFLLIKYTKKLGHNKFFFFLQKLELRLGVILLRARFFYKLINSYTAIKLNLISINGLIVNKTNYILNVLDLFQKRRGKKKKKSLYKKRLVRLKWRKHRWKKARFIFWKIRRFSHFNMHWVKKQNTIINYLEINYKIPAGVILKQPFLKELILNQEPKIISNTILQKIFFLY